MPHPITTKEEYKKRKAELERLMVSAPSPAVNQRLESLVLFIEAYEQKTLALEAVDPIDAIRFRMEQKSLTPRDLEPFIGTRSRVSEVLSGKRPLSLDMVRALNTHLQIPADALIRAKKATEPGPLRELSVSLKSLLVRRKILEPAENLTDLTKRAGMDGTVALPLFRKTLTERANARTNITALYAWTAGVRIEADQRKVAGPFRRERLTPRKLVEIAQISRNPNWAEDVETELSKLGIVLVIMPHLPETYLDGAALRRSDKVPIVALTLRHDRIDNFWFVLLHELSHIAHHFDDVATVFFDDLDLEGTNKQEEEADLSAQEALIPEVLWNPFASQLDKTPKDIHDLAVKAGVHKAIVAGRVRRETGDYRRFSALVGSRRVRIRFPQYAAKSE